MTTLTRNGTPDKDNGQSRVYGGDCNLVHIADGTRKDVGVWLAGQLDRYMRTLATNQGKEGAWDKPLCPGCTMIALFNAAIVLADNSGQPRKELAETMRQAFDKLARNPDSGLTEEIQVILDND